MMIMPVRRASVLVLLVCLAWSIPAPCAARQTDYVVGPTDVLSITVFGEAALSGKYTVGTDGDVTFPLVGRVRVSGLTTRAIEADLRTRLADGLLKNPQVTVEVAEYRSQRVFVVGEVQAPGAIPVTGSTTLLDALARAGSLTDRAGGDLLLLRPESPARDAGPVLPGGAGVIEVARISIQEFLVGAVSDNSKLQHGDTVFVPRAETVDVIGQVNNPGQYTLEKGMTAMRAISLAGGVTRLGSTGRLKIIRIVNGQKTERAAKLDDRLQAGDTLIVLTRLF